MPTLARRSTTPPPVDAATVVNEWGVYDPAVAGIEALFNRVDPDGMRRERERESRPRRKTGTRKAAVGDDVSGVGLAIAEAVARARQHPVTLETRHATAAALVPMATPAAEPVAEPAPPRPRRAVTAMWLRAMAMASTDAPPEAFHGIFGMLRLPVAVALVQYARGCRIGQIHIVDA
ncbi:MAG: hypothetical protein Q8L86_19780 [Vicinamibacterales bacterium]|nr:hypothetical protein [Vicinamibacterales bacterium]